MSSFVTLLVPLAAGVVAALLAWLVVGNSRSAGTTVKERACSNCGSLVLDGWRLCPECGGFIDGPVGGDGLPPSVADDSNWGGPF